MTESIPIEVINLEAFNARLAPHQPEYHRRLNEIVQRRGGSVHSRLRALRALLDDITSHVGENTACRRGCAHCCHIPVLIHEHEATLLAEETGRKMRRPARWRIKRSQQYECEGYSDPCPFLKDGECSVYASRPIACRQHYSLAADETLCRMDEVRDGIPYLNLRMFAQASLMICNSPHAADIRDFFPRAVREEDAA